MGRMTSHIFWKIKFKLVTPLKNMSSSVGMMTFPTEWENEIHVPNHQPDIHD